VVRQLVLGLPVALSLWLVSAHAVNLCVKPRCRG
jgi:hypothetical protein